MGATRSAQQAHRDAINIQRMLSRLETATAQQQQQPSSSYTTSKEYYKTLSTLSSIKYAKNLLSESPVDGQTQLELSRRLEQLESTYNTILSNAPQPHMSTDRPNLEHLRPVIPADLTVDANKDATIAAEGEQDITDAIPADLPTPESKAADALLPLGGEDAFEEGSIGLQRRRSSSSAVPDSINPLSSSRPSERVTNSRASLTGERSSYTSSANKKETPADTQSLSNLLSHHRSEQETLTEELADMAKRLKMNSLEFSQLLEKDKGLLENAEEQLDGNLSGMIKERDRLKEYKKKGGVTTWFVIGSVLAVLFAWLFMFALMRIF